MSNTHGVHVCVLVTLCVRARARARACVCGYEVSICLSWTGLTATYSPKSDADLPLWSITMCLSLFSEGHSVLCTRCVENGFFLNHEMWEKEPPST